MDGNIGYIIVVVVIAVVGLWAQRHDFYPKGGGKK